MQTWKEGKEPAVGPQNGRKNSLGIEGRTTLHHIPNDAEAQVDRDFAGILTEYENAKAEAAAAAAAKK